MELCVECKKKKIWVKKWKLCYTCYQRARNAGKLKGLASYSAQTQTKRRHKREMDFIRNYFNHQNWMYQPAMFYLNGERYTPDFYDRERNVFIEVAGSRQAYEQNKGKYALMKKVFPEIKFEIRTPDGAEIKVDGNLRVVWPKGFHENLDFNPARVSAALNS